MKCFAITHRGCEPFCAEEIAELTGSETETASAHVLFSVGKDQQLADLIYRGQTFGRIGELLSHRERTKDPEEDLTKLIQELELPGAYQCPNSFRVVVQSQEDIDTQDWEGRLGELLIQKYGQLEGKVDLESPQVIVYVHVTRENILAGIDWGGRDLSKRAYKILNYAGSIKGTLASCLARFAGVKKRQTVLDPWSWTGELPIELALRFSRTSPHKYRQEFQFTKIRKGLQLKDTEEALAITLHATDPQLRFVEAVKKNAKIAGVEKLIRISKVDIEWLDTKFDKHSIDHIITKAPSPSKHMSKGLATKLLKELLYQADFILKEGGAITLLCLDAPFVKGVAGEKNYKVGRIHQVWGGHQAYTFLQLTT